MRLKKRPTEIDRTWQHVSSGTPGPPAVTLTKWSKCLTSSKFISIILEQIKFQHGPDMHVSGNKPSSVILNLNNTGVLMTTGIVVFCGSCYAHALTRKKEIRFITPYGGIALILAWLSFIF
ncbi:hypothetical protein FSP39_000826 [Pinctada imbricata]|uniref:Uncharacterized protein n=1 Tax=Pinctada imbricata TaxID=66713 RepID=A0AA88XYF1_PINIB|nr:hypothetical protein FSP39_000826 [Pinctada imbricata]